MRRTLLFALLLLLTCGLADAQLWDEKLEGTGYEETWSAGETVGGSSTLDEDANVTDVSSPPSWDSQCLKSAVVAPDTQAYVQHSWGIRHNISYARVEFIVDAEAVPNSTSISVAAGIDSVAVQTIWDIQIFKDGSGNRILRMILYHNGSPNAYTLSDMDLDKRYRVEVLWDMDADAWAWRIDGSAQDSGSLTGSANGWAFGLLKVGLDSSNAQGTTVYYDNIQVATADWPGPESFTRTADSTNLLWQEELENASGTDETWSEGTTITSGNSLDPDKATSGITGAPADWEVEALEVVVGAAPADDAAHYHHDFVTGKAVAYHRVDFIVDSEGLSDGQANTVIITMNDWPSPIEQNVRMWISQVSGQLGISVTVGITATEFSLGQVASISLDTAYVFEAEWNGTADYWAVWLDDVLLGSGHIRSVWGQTTEHIFVGTSGSGTGRSLTYYADNYSVSEVGYPVAPSGAMLLLGIGP
jgi:hypothetical protein